MKTVFNKKLIGYLLPLSLSVIASTSSQANQFDKKQLIAHLRETFPPVLAEPAVLVEAMANTEIDNSLTKNFAVKDAMKKLFGRKGGSFASDCRAKKTAQGDMDRGECKVFNGEVKGDGNYKELRFSKNSNLGNFSFIRRDGVKELRFNDIQPLQQSSKNSYAMAKKSLADIFGLNLNSLPASPDEKNLPVKAIMLGVSDGKSKPRAVHIEDLVLLQRGLPVNLSDHRLNWLPAPGLARIVLDNRGIQQIDIQNWQSLALHDKFSAKYAKDRFELIEEIADSIIADLGENFDAASLNYRIKYKIAGENKASQALLLPAVQLHISALPRDLTENQQQELAQVSSSGVVFEYNLVNLEEDLGDEQ